MGTYLSENENCGLIYDYITMKTYLELDILQLKTVGYCTPIDFRKDSCSAISVFP